LSAVTHAPEARSLRHRHFRRIYLGESVSLVGTQISAVAIPLAAVTTLGASTLGMGVLTAVEFVPIIVLGLVAGAMVDRLDPRRVIVVTNGVRAVLLFVLSALAASGELRMSHLIVMVLVVSVASLQFDLALQSFVPELLPAPALIDGNARLEASRSLAQIIGPAVAGALVGVAGASFAFAIDGATYVAGMFAALGVTGAAGARPSRGPLHPKAVAADIADGLRFVWHHIELRNVIVGASIHNLGAGALMALVYVFLSRTLDIPAATVGLVLVVAGPTALLGAMVTPRLGRRMGDIPLMIGALFVGGIGVLVLSLAGGPRPVAVIVAAVGLAVHHSAATVFNITMISYRQRVTPAPLLGRVNASARTAIMSALPVGSLLGAAVGQQFGVRTALYAAAAASALPMVVVAGSRHVRRRPAAPEVS